MPRTRRTADRIAGEFLSFRDFVDAALFHPAWGYYATGRVRFGDGGDYETYPDAMSPVFGEMVLGYAFRAWKRLGAPRHFEIAEIGAGNGQLCLDVVTELVHRAGRLASWRDFADAFHYRILERSPALIERQRSRLRGIDERVVWTRCDLSSRRPARAPFAAAGLVVGNEVLDCLAHHKVVPNPGEEPNAVFVVPTIPPGVRARSVALPGADGTALARSELDAFLQDDELASIVRFEERQLPVSMVPPLDRHLRRYCPELFADEHVFPAYFACPDIEVLLRNTAALYDHAEALWIDYGEQRAFHLGTPPELRALAGAPESGRSPYDAPGREDITFIVDFTTVGAAAEAAGWEVVSYGPQADLAARSGVRLDAAACERIVARRGLRFLLGVCGIDRAEPWRRGAVSWRAKPPRAATVRADAKRTIAEFTGEIPNHFKLMILRR